MIRDPELTCANCRFNVDSLCHLNPPMPVPTGGRGGTYSGNSVIWRFPSVNPDDWCSHYVRKQAMKIRVYRKNAPNTLVAELTDENNPNVNIGEQLPIANAEGRIIQHEIIEMSERFLEGDQVTIEVWV